MLTQFHAKYFAEELTRRYPSENLEKLGSSLVDAQVDLNPHQVDAAIFAFQTPLSKGAIIADEVGLGKTIEAGLVVSQKWAERKQKILIITPSSLRKQWSQELIDKFFLPSQILETKSFNAIIKSGNLNPFMQNESIIITSLNFARNKDAYIKAINWDLVIVDEAHRLRNVYKSGNKIAKAIKEAIQHAPKLLLTATPLQNSLLELYGLVSIIDDQVFGDLESFKVQFVRNGGSENGFKELKDRISPICKRTLRKQVLEYIKYTNRIAITEKFVPYEDEQLLYNRISDYLSRPSLYALPNRQRSLMELILRKLLASSSFAIAKTLAALSDRLKNMVVEHNLQKTDPVTEIMISELDNDPIRDEWIDDEENDVDESDEKDNVQLSDEDINKIKLEIAELDDITTYANKIIKNSKGESLMMALSKGFEQVRAKGALEKAIIFTESTRTQQYILDILSVSSYRDKVVLFNGTNTDKLSQEIYRDWIEKYKDSDKISGSKSADMRAALVEYFETTATIMIATEAAAEGINLQFCSLVVNFDLPWNPQRIEQRIGRCHRYGQKNDVVVVNFLNIKNAADVHVYEILDKKFKLFDGVFGASDEVLGSIESGVDFEKRIVSIMQQCRTTEEIEASFAKLRQDLDQEIDETMKQTRQKLFETFDEEVHAKLKFCLDKTEEYVNWFESKLWELTKYHFANVATFTDNYSFTLNVNPYPDQQIPEGPYRLGKKITDTHVFRVGHPLAQLMLADIKDKHIDASEVEFNLSESPVKVSVLEPFVGQSGILMVKKLCFDSLEPEDYVVVSMITDTGIEIDELTAKKLFSLPATVANDTVIDTTLLDPIHFKLKQELTTKVAQRNAKYFDVELEKLEKWADDIKNSLELEIKNLDREIKLKKTESKKLLLLSEKVAAQREIKQMEHQRKNMRSQLFEEQDRADERKEELLANLESKMQQQLTETELFRLKWKII